MRERSTAARASQPPSTPAAPAAKARSAARLMPRRDLRHGLARSRERRVPPAAARSGEPSARRRALGERSRRERARGRAGSGELRGEPVAQRGAPASAAAAPRVDLARRGPRRHAHDLGDLDHAARAVGGARLADDEVERVGDLLAQRRVRQADIGHQRKRLDPAQRLGRRPGVDRAQRAVVARGQRGQHVERLRPTHLADDDPVRAHPQRVADEPANRHLAAALEVRRSRLEPDDVRLAQPQLGGVLDRDHALAGADEARQRVERRRLAGAGAAADEHARAGAHGAGEEHQQRPGQRPVGDQLLGREAAAAEAADRQHRAVERQRRDHDVHARAVGQPRVAQRLGLVDPAAERREDALDRVAQLGLGAEAHRRGLEPAAALDPHRRRPAHHDLVDGGVAQQRLERAEPERPLGDPAGELGPRARVEHRRLAIHERADAVGQLALAGIEQQALAQVGGELVEVVRHPPAS